MSLRARLIIGLISLAGFGLLAAGAITYAEQRSSLFGRVDDQLAQTGPFVGRALDSKLGVATAPGAGAAAIGPAVAGRPAGASAG